MYYDLSSFSFQKDYLYTAELDRDQPLENFYDESDSDYNFYVNIGKYYIYVCNKDTGNVLDEMSVEITPYYYSGGAEEFLGDISYKYYYYDKAERKCVESDNAPTGDNLYYETSGYVYATADSSKLINNIIKNDTVADIIFSGSENVPAKSSGEDSTNHYSSLTSLVDYMTKPYGRKGILFLAGKYLNKDFLAIGYYDGKGSSAGNLAVLGCTIVGSAEFIKATVSVRADGLYYCDGFDSRFNMTVKTIGIIRLP